MTVDEAGLTRLTRGPFASCDAPLKEEDLRLLLTVDIDPLLALMILCGIVVKLILTATKKACCEERIYYSFHQTLGFLC